MPTIYDNRKVDFLSGLSSALDRSYKSDICTAYFNLRGWKKLAPFIDKYIGGGEKQCRLLLGMYAMDWQFKKEILQEEKEIIDNKTAKRLKTETLKKFKNQLMMGIPSNEDEKGLQKLAQQLREKKVIVKCFTRHPLHAKLYLTFNNKEFAQKIGFLGSSNLTYSGLEKNGELNIDVLDQKSCKELSHWFEDKWQDQFSLDISESIIQLIEDSWAGTQLVSPYDIYMKMAYHLSEPARKGLTDFFIPKELQNKLFDFQSAVVRIAARYVYYKNGVLIGDVVGLGKTLMATATVKILEEEQGWQTLILCPKNLEAMWDNYIQTYQLRAKIIPISQTQQKLPQLKRYQLMIIDESHNLRNPFGKRYQAVKDYIAQNDCKCILLSATPYNKTYTDLSSQLGLFIDSDQDLGIRPYKYLKENHFEGLASSLKAFEKSPHAEDWQNLMSQFLIRRTRSFIKQNYGKKSAVGRYYIEDSKGQKKFFPDRVAKTVPYPVDEQYKRLFSEEVVDMINNLKLARYDLANPKYLKKNSNLTAREKEIFKDLERSRAHPKGFCRINLFKRLESSGFSFLQSVQRHVLRNIIFIYAIETKQDLIIGEKSSEIIASAFEDKEGGITGFSEEDTKNNENLIEDNQYFLTKFESFYSEAEKLYKKYKEKNSKSLRWISSSYFTDQLKKDLMTDCDQFISLLQKSKNWNPAKDFKLKELENLLKEKADKKILIFTQSKETAIYLQQQLVKRNLKKSALITGGMDNIQPLINRFSPNSNNFDIKSSKEPEINILITTDVLSEGQNLQDCHIVINYDLPWAIIRLIQRVGRVDRIGQNSETIFCYSFMHDNGLEKQLKLRSRIKNRLKENAEVIGTDEQFFENERQILIDLYNEKSETLEKEMDEDIDLSSFALEIWNKGIKQNPVLEEKIKNMPDVVHASKKAKNQTNGVLLFAKSHTNNYLMHLNQQGQSLKEDSMSILKLAQCQPETPALKRTEAHHEIVRQGLKTIKESFSQMTLSNRLGTGRNPRRKLFEKLENKAQKDEEENQMLEDIYHYPLSNESENTFQRMFRQKIKDKEIFNLMKAKHRNETLVNKKESKQINESPRIICSMGLVV